MRLLLFSLLLFSGSVIAQDMDNQRLDSLYHAVLDTISGEPGRWELTLGEVQMLCLTDETHDRMRIITPIKPIAEATAEEIYKCLEANFHTALDVKYALADDIIWVAYIHPLSPLQDAQVIDALAQVRSAALTYGTVYTSTHLVFPKPDGEEGKSRAKGPVKRRL
ncbi:MAG: hypothetical protein AAFZ52_02055 [Bacteroidota bacterium]